ncbi:DUF4367 domain-containing protein [Tissierella sp. Yu-01]|uniref:DUF4367 domain-containing protein n=1 Tax=Tissierella sp. Yu-01 TaxID=3035694 RepID=UPI00240E8D77|nr:DUF4367 domain-containing protein [Tissierella sp. Yu-01]WFA08800.1 DUF4367 domain-containing protein [Tissierella sp. Yu-01]
MNKKKLEDRFFMDMESYINGKENLNIENEEYKELLELGKTLTHEDFSKSSNRTEILNRSLENIKKYKGEDNMKKSKKVFIKAASFVLICILGISTMRTSFAQELVDKIANFISIGHVTVYEDPIYNEGELVPVPDELKGKIFDKDGNPIEEVIVGNPPTMYTPDGEEIISFESETLKIITDSKAELENNNLVVKDTDKLNDYTCFEVILPKYLPEGYEFDRAEFFRDENGIVENTKYISLYFTNDETGEYIYMQQRFADEETAYAAGGQNIEQLKINGADAILYDNNLDWEDDGVIYALSGRGMIPRDELIKTAESFK